MNSWSSKRCGFKWVTAASGVDARVKFTGAGEHGAGGNVQGRRAAAPGILGGRFPASSNLQQEGPTSITGRVRTPR